MSIEGFGEWLQAAAVGETLRSIAWLVPLLQSIHVVLIGVVFVSVLAVAARVLGWWRAEEPLARTWRRFAPFLWWGLAMMALTGLLLVIAEPLRELMTLSFRIKMLLLGAGTIAALAFGRRLRAAAGATAAPAALPVSMRLGAVATVLLWLFIIFLGRAIAYDDSVWGELSPAVLQRAASQ
jgi:hypothetical protein